MDAFHGDSWPGRLKTCAVLGGRGFVGRSLVSRLLRLGGWTVRIADFAQFLELEPDAECDSLLKDALSTGRASYHCVDVRDKSQIVKAIEGSYVVYYMGPTGLHAHDYYYCYKVIVQGTRNVISACLDSKVRQLIYNSTAEVVFNGLQDISDGDESLTCPRKFQSMVIDFKAQAEALVRFANVTDSLLTCALRPSIAFGPGDTEFVPFLVDLAKSGFSKFIIGNGENMSDFTYVENVAHAHICAAEALDSRAEFVAGKVFFISNLKSTRFWAFVSNILEGLGYPRPSIKLPFQFVWYIFSLLKWTEGKLGFRVDRFSTTANHIIRLASRTRTFNCSAAKKQIGYSPVVSLEDGIVSTLQSFSHLSKDSYFARYGDSSDQSKANKLLGGGKVADILLWRDEKKTFACFLLLNLLFCWFFFPGRTFISSIALFLLLVAVVFYGYSIAPSNIFGFPVKRIHLSSFEIPESATRDLIRTTAGAWNRGVRDITSLTKAGDWNKFFRVVGLLYLLKLIVSQSLAAVIFVALALSFTVFFVYEQYEIEIDRLARILFKCSMGLKGVLMENLAASVAPFLHNYGTSAHQRKKM